MASSTLLQILSWDHIGKVLAAGFHTILFGPPGMGKTRIAATDQAAYSITLTEETPAAELRGHFVPKGQSFEWHDGPALKAWREGKRLILNEIDKASGDALTFLLAILDDPEHARLTLPTGETVRPMPGFQAVSTTNVMDLANGLPEALLDRFAVRILVNKPSDDAFARLSPDLRLAAESSVTLDDAERRVSYRQWLAFDNLRSAIGDAKIAAKAVFGVRHSDIATSFALTPVSTRRKTKTTDPTTGEPTTDE